MSKLMKDPSTSKHTASFGLVMGGKLKLKGEKMSKPRKRSKPELEDDEEEELEMPVYSADPVVGTGKLATSGVVVMGIETDFTKELDVGDTLLVTVSDKYRNIETQESRIVNMVLGKGSLNLEGPFSCDLTSPTNFMVVKRAPDMEAIKRARKEERKRAKTAAEDAKQVTYKVLKNPGSGPWGTWTTVTEKVDGAMSREDMLQKRVKMKADRFCK
mmetsp:Transcript_41191/g.68506  ORF Transcript_41191/g.68506 Transcript_41191/m.68506 type:complete len:215 (+) Transcript_41191:16-660(+)